ncbi:MAG TPA: hypothetical protein VGI81_15525 [Tepidisphaeraceae bacterium]|jgi:riboflavin transporter FmnP
MPEPLPLEYATPTPQPGVVRATFILGIACGPLAYGVGALLSFLFDNVPVCWAGIVSPFVTVAVLGVAAFAATRDEGHRRRAADGLAAGGVWAVAWTVFVVYAFLTAYF